MLHAEWGLLAVRSYTTGGNTESKHYTLHCYQFIAHKMESFEFHKTLHLDPLEHTALSEQTLTSTEQQTLKCTITSYLYLFLTVINEGHASVAQLE